MSNVDWLSVLINWFPMLLLIAVWIWVMQRLKGGKIYGAYQKDVLEEQRRQTTALERIAQALENKSGHA